MDVVRNKHAYSERILIGKYQDSLQYKIIILRLNHVEYLQLHTMHITVYDTLLMINTIRRKIYRSMFRTSVIHVSHKTCVVHNHLAIFSRLLLRFVAFCIEMR